MKLSKLRQIIKEEINRFNNNKIEESLWGTIQKAASREILSTPSAVTFVGGAEKLHAEADKIREQLKAYRAIQLGSSIPEENIIIGEALFNVKEFRNTLFKISSHWDKMLERVIKPVSTYKDEKGGNKK